MATRGQPGRSPLDEELVQIISTYLSLLGEPSRIRILDGLRFGERNVQGLTDELVTTQQNVSGHLRLLHRAGLVVRRTEGREVFYAIVDTAVFDVWSAAIIVVERALPAKGG